MDETKLAQYFYNYYSLVKIGACKLDKQPHFCNWFIFWTKLITYQNSTTKNVM